MPRFFIRSTIFNVCFYISTALACIILLPTLLMPRSVYLAVVSGFVHVTAFLERAILGLTYEIRGKEHLPDHGPYIVAAKHQSAYETFKLHILFRDPAIVLKKELLKIPLWGRYLAKSDVIAIDRTSPKLAIKSIQDGAKHVASQNRPIVIFPQGTRVAPTVTAAEKPYKIGIIRMQEATNLPIIPMALNTGIFYPKHSWIKKPGHVVFEFMPPIPASSAPPAERLRQIESIVEEQSSILMEEGKMSIPKSKKSAIAAMVMIILSAALYNLNWFVSAHFVMKGVENYLVNLEQNPNISDIRYSTPKLTGYPYKLNLEMEDIHFKSQGQVFNINLLQAQSWPLLNMPISIQAQNINVLLPRLDTPLFFNAFNAILTHHNNVLTIKESALYANTTIGRVSGIIDTSKPPYPIINLNLDLENHMPFLLDLVAKNLVKQKEAMFASIALNALQQDGVVHTTLTSQDNKIYLGPLRIFELP